MVGSSVTSLAVPSAAIVMVGAEESASEDVILMKNESISKVGLTPKLVTNPASSKYSMVNDGGVVSVNAAFVASFVGFALVAVVPPLSVPVIEMSSSVEPTAAASDVITLVYV